MPPKPAAQRRRRNAAPKVVKLEEAKPALSGGRRPPLPGAAGLHSATRAWWATVWASPMAAVYLDADVPALVRAAMFIDQVNTGAASVETYREIRQLEDRFGLSPLARRRLQWEVEQATGAKAPADDVADQGDRWLRAVSG